jgi:hypothetical protein
MQCGTGSDIDHGIVTVFHRFIESEFVRFMELGPFVFTVVPTGKLAKIHHAFHGAPQLAIKWHLGKLIAHHLAGHYERIKFNVVSYQSVGRFAQGIKYVEHPHDGHAEFEGGFSGDPVHVCCLIGNGPAIGFDDEVDRLNFTPFAIGEQRTKLNNSGLMIAGGIGFKIGFAGGFNVKKQVHASTGFGCFQTK